MKYDYDNNQDKAICELRRGGASYRDIVSQALCKNPNGRLVARVRSVLEKYGFESGRRWECHQYEKCLSTAARASTELSCAMCRDYHAGN